jgi:hypothetical protein
MTVKVVVEEIEVESARYLDNAQTEMFVLEPSGRTRVVTLSQHPMAFKALSTHKDLEVLTIEKQKALVKAREDLEAKKAADFQAAAKAEADKIAADAVKQVAEEEKAAQAAAASPPGGASDSKSGDSSSPASGATPTTPVPSATSPSSTS